jgi:hypothetical protein
LPPRCTTKSAKPLAKMALHHANKKITFLALKASDE